MGYIAHDVVIVTGFSWSKPLPDVDAFRAEMPAELRHLVVGPIKSAINDYLTWFFAPDGSKEGWDESDQGNVWRVRFVALFQDSTFDILSVRYGGDYGVECGVTVTDLSVDEDDDDD